jgi:hypothetical protein
MRTQWDSYLWQCKKACELEETNLTGQITFWEFMKTLVLEFFSSLLPQTKIIKAHITTILLGLSVKLSILQ